MTHLKSYLPGPPAMAFSPWLAWGRGPAIDGARNRHSAIQAGWTAPNT